MDKDVNRVLNYLTERLEIAINHSKDDEQRGYIRAKGMVNDARELGFKPDMRKKVREYIDELDAEYDRCMDWIEEHINGEACKVSAMEMRAKTLMEVKNDIQSRLEELV